MPSSKRKPRTRRNDSRSAPPPHPQGHRRGTVAEVVQPTDGAMYLRAVVVWAGAALALLANEALHRMLYLPALGRFEAQVLASLVGAAALVGAAHLVVRNHPEAAHRQWVRIGWLWLALTLGFQLAHGRYLGLEWIEVLDRFNLLRGGLGALVPLSALLAPAFWSRRLYRRVDARLWFRP